MGMHTARDSLRWHLIETSPGAFDFSSALPMIRAARESGIQVIWDLMHYGWPDDLDILSPEFIHRFAAFARAAAGILQEETQGAPIICPINEISFFSWAAGEVAYFYPFLNRRGEEVKEQMIRAAIAAMEAIWEVAPDARFVHCDPLIHVTAHPKRPHQKAAAERHRRSQFQSWDMISGRRKAHLGGHPKYLDIIGANYYIHNQWIHGGGPNSLLPPKHELHRPIWEILQEIHARYQRPIFIAETGIEAEERPAWLRYISNQAREAIHNGVPISGLCLYPICNHPGWDDERHCHNGLWDYADEAGGREIFAPLEIELKQQQQAFEAFMAGEGSTPFMHDGAPSPELQDAARKMKRLSEFGRKRRRR